MNAQALNEWVSKAEQDWQAILQLLSVRPEMVPDVIAFHAQQTAEKYLKALLLQSGEEPPPIHNLGAVLDQVVIHYSEAETLREDAESLTPFAVRIRYPGLSISVDKATESVERARRIRAFVLTKLGLPLEETK